MFSLGHIHAEGKMLRSRRDWKDPENPFAKGTTALAAVILLCACVTFGVTKPDLRMNPVFVVGGYYNVCIAIDYPPCNLIGAIGYQLAVCWWLHSAWFFVKRAELADKLGLTWFGTLNVVRGSALTFSLTAPWMLICFLRPPDFTQPTSINTHLRCFEIYIYGCIVWFTAQWYFAIQVISRKHHYTAKFAIATFVFFTSSCLKLWGHQLELDAWWSIPEAKTGAVTPEIMHRMHRDSQEMLYSPMQLIDYAWLISMACWVKYNTLCNWDPASDYGDCQRGPSVCAAAKEHKYAPYIPAPPENELQNQSTMDELMETYHVVDEEERAEGNGDARTLKAEQKENVDRTGQLDRQWGATLGHVNCIFEIDHRIDLLHPDLRKGFLAKPGKYEAIARVSLCEGMMARMAFRVKLPADTDASELLIPYLRDIGLPSLYLDEEPELIADFLLQEDLKEFWTDSADVMIAADQASNRPPEMGMLEWLWDYVLNMSRIMRMNFQKNRQAARTHRDGKLSKNGIWGKRYFGGLPFRLGMGACKWGLVPRQIHDVGRGPEASGIEGKTPSESYQLAMEKGKQRYQSSAEAMLKEKDVVFEFVVQVATHERHSCEEIDAIWPEDLSPYYGVGKLTIKAGETFKKQGKERMVFSVWHNYKEHRPIGPLNNARGYIYKKEGVLTAKRTGCCPVVGLST